MGTDTYTIAVTTTGSAGSATGTADSVPIRGEIVSIKTDYHTSAPNTTTVTYTEFGGMGQAILSLSASNTDATHYPSTVVNNASGAAVTDASRPILLTGTKVRVAVASSNALTDAVVVTVKVKRA